MSRISLKKIQKQKKIKKITCLTAYTSSIAKIVDRYVDIILVGDSVGTVIYGMKNTQKVTLDMMMRHGKAVVDSTYKAFTIIDMPFNTYRNKNEALKNAKKLLNYTRSQAIKLETNEKTLEIVKYLVKNKIKVATHIGVTPQKYKNFSKIRSVGNNLKEKEKIYNLALKLERAGSCLVVLECLKENLAEYISNNLKIPTIGIGASIKCDGQILVINDILNTDATIKQPKFIKNYAKINILIENAVKKYCSDVLQKRFPKKNHTYK